MSKTEIVHRTRYCIFIVYVNKSRRYRPANQSAPRTIWREEKRAKIEGNDQQLPMCSFKYMSIYECIIEDRSVIGVPGRVRAVDKPTRALSQEHIKDTERGQRARKGDYGRRGERRGKFIGWWGESLLFATS